MKTTNIFFLLFAIGLLFSCNKHDFNYAEGTVGSSKIIYYPSVNINGEHLVIINQGDNFSDPGARAVLNGQPTSFTVGKVDPSVPGIYNLTYEAKNAQGYSASDWRTVVVISPAVASNDFSGTYLRTATGVTSTWTKTGTGQYMVDNPGGAVVGVGYKVIVVNYEGNKIAIPKQFAADPSGNIGIVSSANETYNAQSSPPFYTWVFLAGGYGTSLRKFIKQ